MQAWRLLVDLTAARPAFADIGYDLKVGFILAAGWTGLRADRRPQQLSRRDVRLVRCAGIVTLLRLPDLLRPRGLVAPVNRVYAATIKAGVARGWR